MRIKCLIFSLTLAWGLCGLIAFAQQIDPSTIKPNTKPAAPTAVEFITPEELKTKIAGNEALAIVDVRGASIEQGDSMIRGSVHSQVRKVAYRLREVPRDREVVTYCSCPADEAAIIAARSLMANGFKR